MFFDNNGYLFSGGDGITVFRPDGTICYDQAAMRWLLRTLTFDPANNEVLVVPSGSSTGALYHAADLETVPEPSTLILLLAGGLISHLPLPTADDVTNRGATIKCASP